MNILRKTLAVGVALATFGVVIASSTAPAAAQWGFGWGHGIGAGLVLGAAVAATAPAYGYGYGYGCYIAHQPVYDDYGNYIGVHRVRVCN
jgi:hypothetical protein